MTSSDKTLQLLGHIGNELKLLWCQMDAYQELFLVEPEKRADLLQKTAPGFFVIAQVSMTESILMRLFRLMDPTKTGKNENSSLQHLKDTLHDEIPGHSSLKDEIGQIGFEWVNNNNRFTPLKNARNKFLAHNDFDERSFLPTNQLWINLSWEEFDAARQLGGLLWELYRRCNRVLLGKDVVEPIHSSLENRPSMLLKHLCATRYLYSVIDDESEHIEKLHAFERAEMGVDVIRPVFSAQVSSSMSALFSKGVQP